MEGLGRNCQKVGDRIVERATNVVPDPPNAPRAAPLPVVVRARTDLCGRARGWHDERRRWLERATWAFVGLGLLTRLVRYLVVYPIWHDEAFLAVNFLDRGYGDLLRPLDYAQVSPILFLWVELTVVRLLGFSEWSLRLFPAVCGLASVILFRHVAGRVLRGIPLLLAVGIFATAFYPVRHAAEVKPYASDLLASLLLLALAIEWWRTRAQSSLVVLAAVVPVLLAISYPAVFVAAGLSVALAFSVLRRGIKRVRLAFLVYNVVLIASFLSIYFGATVFQSSALRDGYRWGYWYAAFPPWSEPWKLIFWLVDVHAGNALAYPLGGEHGGSTATLLAVAMGILGIWRRRQRTLLALLMSPCLMGLVAAGLGQYPYGGAPRLTQYLAPSICLLAGVGASVVVARLSPGIRRRQALALSIALLVAIGVFLVVRDLCEPYRVRGDLETRQFARAFWQQNTREVDLVCVKSDLGLNFQPHLWSRGMSAVYLFYRGMFAQPRMRNYRVETWIGGMVARPARLVFYDDLPEDEPAFKHWLAWLGRSYSIAPRRDYTVNPGKPGELWLRDRYVVLDLVPRELDGDRMARAPSRSAVVR